MHGVDLRVGGQIELVNDIHTSMDTRVLVSARMLTEQIRFLCKQYTYVYMTSLLFVSCLGVVQPSRRNGILWTSVSDLAKC